MLEIAKYHHDSFVSQMQAHKHAISTVLVFSMQCITFKSFDIIRLKQLITYQIYEKLLSYVVRKPFDFKQSFIMALY